MSKVIFAPATPPGRGAIAIVRISGDGTASVLEALTHRPLPRPREMRLRRLYDGAGNVLDEAQIAWFPGPDSFTGEDMGELYLHGGRAVIEGVLSALSALVREGIDIAPAEAGAFSRHAVLNGRFDLTQAEAMADLIDAESAAQVHQALRQMRGALGVLYMGWRAGLISILAHLEADIEFVEEGLPDDVAVRARAALVPLMVAIEAHLGDTSGFALRAGLEVAILGAPNVGKSSLLNRLSGREAAIVSAQAGTTRDIVEVSMTLDGVPVRLADTAGLRAAGDDIEREGVRRAVQRAAVADMRIFVYAPDIAAISFGDLIPQKGDFILINKSDLGKKNMGLDLPSDVASYHVSAKSGAGLDEFYAALIERLALDYSASDMPVFTRLRHQQALCDAHAALARVMAADMKTAPELVAEDMRLAVRMLGRITGAVDIESVLDVVFADFCIGK